MNHLYLKTIPVRPRIEKEFVSINSLNENYILITVSFMGRLYAKICLFTELKNRAEAPEFNS